MEGPGALDPPGSRGRSRLLSLCRIQVCLCPYHITVQCCLVAEARQLASSILEVPLERDKERDGSPENVRAGFKRSIRKRTWAQDRGLLGRAVPRGLWLYCMGRSLSPLLPSTHVSFFTAV